jgi:hypothetical protein
MSELRNFHMLLLAAEYVEGDAALRAEIWAEMDAADCHRRVRPRLSSTLQQSRSPYAPAHGPVLRSSSTLQQNRSPSAPLGHEVVPRVQYRPTAPSTGVRTGVRTRSSRLNPDYRNSEPVALTMITGLRNVPIRQETRRLTERPEPLPVASRPPPRPSQQLPDFMWMDFRSSDIDPPHQLQTMTPKQRTGVYTFRRIRFAASQLSEDCVLRIMSMLSLKDLSICACLNKQYLRELMDSHFQMLSPVLETMEQSLQFSTPNTRAGSLGPAWG